jgi:hypothetical protein
MQRIKLSNTTGDPEDCSRYEKWLDDAGIPSNESNKESPARF